MFDDSKPIYRQIADQITTDILRGTLHEEEQVMSTNQYAAYYRINPATVAKGFQQLVDEQLLYRKRGIGMFVSPGARDRLLASHRQRFFTGVVDPMLAEARTIAVSVDDIIRYLQQQGTEDESET